MQWARHVLLLQSCNSSFAVIERSLNAYLDSKKLLFPRFFFLSNDELIEVREQDASSLGWVALRLLLCVCSASGSWVVGVQCCARSRGGGGRAIRCGRFTPLSVPPRLIPQWCGAGVGGHRGWGKCLWGGGGRVGHVYWLG